MPPARHSASARLLVAFIMAVIAAPACTLTQSAPAEDPGTGIVPSVVPLEREWPRTIGESVLRGLSPHAPITINGNSGFTSANGVTNGSGTMEDPFIIEDWVINCSAKDGIQISNSNSYFIIRHSVLYDGYPWYSGISLYRVENGIIENCTISNHDNGIFATSCQNLGIFGNVIRGFRIGGVRLDACAFSSTEGIHVKDNAISFGGEGIWASGSRVNATGNTITDTGAAADSWDSFVFLTGNTFTGNRYGIYGQNRLSDVIDNRISGNQYGMYFNMGSVNIIDNVIENNSVYGIYLDICISGNISGNRITRSLNHGILISSTLFRIADTTLLGCGISFDGAFIGGSIANTTVNGKPVYYFQGEKMRKAPPDAGQILISRCDGMVVEDISFSGVGDSILAYGSNNISLANVTIADAAGGARFSSCTGVRIENLTVRNVSRCLSVESTAMGMANSTLGSPANGTDLQLGEGAMVDSINNSLNESRVNMTSSNAVLNVFWFLSVQLRDAESGLGIPNGTVRVENLTCATKAKGTTGADGFVRYLLLFDHNLSKGSKYTKNQYRIFADAPYYSSNYTGTPLRITASREWLFNLTELTEPRSEVTPLPEYWNSTAPMPIRFVASDNGSGIDYVELCFYCGGEWIPYEAPDGTSRFVASPILFYNHSTEGEYYFYSIARDRSGHSQGPPYTIRTVVMDRTPPDFVISPRNGTDNTTVNEAVRIRFGERMNTSSLKVELWPGKWNLKWVYNWTELWFYPIGELEYSTKYTVSVLDGTDLAGNHIAPCRTVFTTLKRPEPDIISPTVISIIPTSGSILVPGPAVITIVFSEPMNWTGVTGALRINGKPAPVGSGNGTGYSFTLDAKAGATYTLILDTTASDIAGNGLSSTFAASFTCAVPGIPLGSISGRVVSESGDGLAGVNVTIGLRRIVTDINGFFNASRLAGGTYLVNASGLRGYFPNETTFNLAPGENMSVNLMLHAMNGSLRGFIRIGDGRPIVGASVAISSNGETVARVLSNRTGSFSVALRPGTYTIKVSVGGFYTVILEDQVVLPGQQIETEPIVLAYRANEPASSVIPLTVIAILGAAALAMFIHGMSPRRK